MTKNKLSFSRKPGRPANPANKNRQVTWVRLTPEQRRVLMDDFGGYQRGLEVLVERYIKQQAEKQK